MPPKLTIGELDVSKRKEDIKRLYSEKLYSL